MTPEGDRPAEVSAAVATGTTAVMSDDTREQDQTDTDLSRDVESPRGEWGGPPRDERGALGGDEPTTAADDDASAATDADSGAGAGSADAAQQPTIIGDVEDFASTEPLLAADQSAPVERDETPAADAASTDAGDVAGDADHDHDHDHDHAADHEHDHDAGDSGDDAGSADAAQEPTIIGDIEDFAATEPLLSGDQGTTVEHDEAPATDTESTESSDVPDADAERGTDTHDSVTEDADEHATAETGAAVATTSDDAPATDEPAEGSSEDRFDPTPTRDWAADEGELLEENRERGEALEEDRADLTADEADGETSDETTDETVGETSDETVGGDTSSEATSAEPTATDDGHDEGPGDSAARRISEFHELRDGGYGVGSAATLDDGAQPLDHPIAGYRDTMTFRSPGDEGYDDATPDVWFYDQAAAERSGFSRSEV